MSECPHLVIGMSGRCESCFQVVIDPSTILEGRGPKVKQPTAKVLRARWAASFGSAQDVRKAIEALDNSQDESDKETARLFHAAASERGLLK